MEITITNGTDSFDFDNSTSGTVIERYSGFEYPLTRELTPTLPSSSGGVFIQNLFGTRIASWEGTIIGTDKDNALTLRRNMEKVAKTNELLTIELTTYDELDLQFEGTVRTLLMPYTRSVQRYMVEVVAPDWRLYSQTLTTDNTGITESNGGTAIPTVVPITLAASSNNNLTVVNAGNEFSDPTFVIQGPGSNFVIQNLTTGDKIELNLTLTSGEAVTIDTNAKTAKKGANQNVYGSLVVNAGSWMPFVAGSNEIYFNAGSGTTAATSLTVSFRSAYRGI